MEFADSETSEPTVLVADGSSDGEWAVSALGAAAFDADAEAAASEAAATAAELPAATAAAAGFEGVETVVVSGRDAALDVLDDRTADCVITAAELANGTGVDLTEAVRDREPDLPVLYAPASGSARDARDATVAGATRYLPRDGLEDGELVAAVADVVDTYDERRRDRWFRGMFRALFSNLPLSVYFKDEEARHVCASSHVTASTDQRVLGKTDLDLYADDIGEEEARAAYEDDLAVVESEEPVFEKEERHVTEEGEVMWLRTSKVPWREDGEVVGLIGITRVVTEIKENELELEQEKRRLEQFASFVSHDLRNPVNIAKGYLQQGIGNDDEEALREVVVSLDRMDQMIDDLLNMARPEQDQVLDEWSDLAEVARDTWSSVGDEVGAIGDGSATLRVEVPEGTELLAARGALRQILENLFKNAIEYGGEGVTVTVGLLETGFYVADDGAGIPPEDREKVFDYGYTTEGTGVGLAIVKDIADGHDWSRVVTEADAGGARFEFTDCIRRPPPCEELDRAEPIELVEQRNVDGAQPPGSAERVGEDGWIVRGGGRNVWGDIDEYYAVHAPAEGDVRIEARLADLNGSHEYAKAGVVVADAIEPGRPLGFLGMTSGHASESIWRTSPETDLGSRQHDHPADEPAWFRIDRIGRRVTCWVSTDGEEWTVVDQNVLELSESVDVGLLVGSHNERRLSEAEFESVRVVELDPQEP